MNGLLEFYQPIAGVTRLASRGGAALDNFTVGNASAISDASGTYGTETFSFRYLPYKLVAGVKTFLGIGRTGDAVNTSAINNAVLLPAPVVTGGAVDGVYVTRYNHGTAAVHHRDLAFAEFPVTDLGTSWTPGFWFDFNTIPQRLPVLWAKLGVYTNPQLIDTALSPLGGAAFDSTGLLELSNYMAADLVVRPQLTMSFWFCPTEDQSSFFSAIRGASSAGRINLSCEVDVSGSFAAFGFSDAVVSFADHTLGDWYLITASVDDYWEEEWLTRMVVQRLRDGAIVSATGSIDMDGFLVAANAGSSISDALEGAVTAVGGTAHWGAKAAGFFDRIGIWNRVLSAEEIERLYGVGLGWAPA